MQAKIHSDGATASTGLIDLDGQVDLLEDGGHMLAPLERAGVTNRAPFRMGFHADLRGPLQRDAGRFLDLEDDHLEAVVVVVIEDDVPGKLLLRLLIGLSETEGLFKGLGAHIMIKAGLESVPIRSAVSSR